MIIEAVFNFKPEEGEPEAYKGSVIVSIQAGLGHGGNLTKKLAIQLVSGATSRIAKSVVTQYRKRLNSRNKK